MAKVDISELVEMYEEVLDHDNREEGVRVFIFKNKDDFLKKYVEHNLLDLKINEPINGEKYDDTFKKFVDEINLLIKPFKNDELIIIGVFGKHVDKIDINSASIALYHEDEIELLLEDINNLYN